ncbi:hypothetical protein GCM10027168_13010 [Streptomyces capparidis]
MPSPGNLAVAVVTTVAIAGGFTVSATAATTAPESAVGPQGIAPACVTRDVVKQEKKVTIKNNCGKTMHVKLVIDNGPDGQCWTYRHGESRLWKWKTGSYDKVVTC